MKKIAMVYYSATGNTMLACRRLEAGLRGAQVDFIDCRAGDVPDPAAYGAFGFAVPAFHLAPPPAMGGFLGRLHVPEGTPAFLLVTYGMMAGRTPLHLESMARKSGFRVFASHCLPVPESYPPFLAKGFTNAEAPSDTDLARFDAFIAAVDAGLSAFREGRLVEEARVRTSLLERIIPPASARKARAAVGRLSADPAVCRRCGTCARSCGNGAVALSPLPAFDAQRCAGCWSCFNNCPSGALLSSAVDGKWRYAPDRPRLADRLTVPRDARPG